MEEVCKPKNIEAKEDPERKYLNLNRCEDYLLKLVIPFIRVAHLPRGRYFKVIGDLILISADLMQTMDKILPVNQSLIPVSFKRSLKYKGHFIEEYVDKEKLLAYFSWFKENNHLFKDFTFNTCLIDEFQNEAIEKSKNMNEEKGGNLEIPKIDVETVPTNHSSHLRNKYMEDIESKTVANNLADFIVHIEKDHENPFKRQLDDEEEMRYSDDEEENDSNEDLEDSTEKNEQENGLLREIQLKSRTIVENLAHLPNSCLHVIDIAISQLCGLMNDTEKMSGEKEKVLEMKKEVVTILSNGIRSCVLKKNDIKDLDCNHVETDLSRNLKYMKQCTMKILTLKSLEARRANGETNL